MILPALPLALLLSSLPQIPAPTTTTHVLKPALRAEQRNSDRATSRAIDDVQAACRHLLATDHAYTGSVSMALGEPTPETPRTIAYRGSRRETLRLLRLDAFTVLQNGNHQIERKNEGAWSMPQGEAPDCPLAPASLAAHMPTATITAPTATAHADRPAMRVHAEWHEEAAAALLEELSVPHPKYNQLLERLPFLARKHGDRLWVDASVSYDPATKQIYAATLRVSLLSQEDPPEDQDPKDLPAGLPPLPKQMVGQFLFCFTMQPPEAEPMPELDETLRTRLALPAR